MSEPSIEADADVAMIKKHVQQLIEHGDFDTVHIFASRHQPGSKDSGTRVVQSGAGHWHARYGQIREWVVKEEEKMRIEERGDGE